MSSGAGAVAPGMSTFSAAMLTQPTASQSLAPGDYTVTADSPERGSPSVQAPIIQTVPAGTIVTVLGTVNNYFADIIAPSALPTGTRGWLSVASLTPTAATTPATPGGPLTGANSPPPGTPGAPVPAPTTPGTYNVPSGGGGIMSGLPTWALPAALVAAGLGWFFLVEQKQGGGGGKAKRKRR